MFWKLTNVLWLKKIIEETLWWVIKSARMYECMSISKYEKIAGKLITSNYFKRIDYCLGKVMELLSASLVKGSMPWLKGFFALGGHLH